MSESPKPATRTISAWWFMLVLAPLALFIGWYIPSLPQPTPTRARTPLSGPEASGRAADPQFRTPAPAGDESPDQPSTQAWDGTWGSGSTPAVDDGRSEPPQAGDGAGVRWTSLSEAMDESRQTGKPILLDFNADWCGPCRAMKRAVFEDPTCARAVEAVVVPVSVVDRFREENVNSPETDRLQRKFEIEAFPTLVVLSPETGRFTKRAGFAGAERTLDWIVEAARAVR